MRTAMPNGSQDVLNLLEKVNSNILGMKKEVSDLKKRIASIESNIQREEEILQKIQTRVEREQQQQHQQQIQYQQQQQQQQYQYQQPEQQQRVTLNGTLIIQDEAGGQNQDENWESDQNFASENQFLGSDSEEITSQLGISQQSRYSQSSQTKSMRYSQKMEKQKIKSLTPQEEQLVDSIISKTIIINDTQHPTNSRWQMMPLYDFPDHIIVSVQERALEDGKEMRFLTQTGQQDPREIRIEKNGDKFKVKTAVKKDYKFNNAIGLRFNTATKKIEEFSCANQ